MDPVDPDPDPQHWPVVTVAASVVKGGDSDFNKSSGHGSINSGTAAVDLTKAAEEDLTRAVAVDLTRAAAVDLT
jgi:hypothetical protein